MHTVTVLCTVRRRAVELQDYIIHHIGTQYPEAFFQKTANLCCSSTHISQSPIWIGSCTRHSRYLQHTHSMWYRGGSKCFLRRNANLAL